MEDLAGKVAFVTGGGNGLGLAMARAFAGAGMKLVLADVDQEALDAAAASFRGENVPVLTVQLDVTDRNAWADAAQRAVDEFGAIHVLCNNAGVFRGGTLDAVTYQDWDWVMGVNVGGVVNGLQSVIPHIKAHGEGGHIVNTASMAGMTGIGGMGIYNASKFAVVGMSEALRDDLEPHGIGVSVLCPGMVRTRILDSERVRPDALDGKDDVAEASNAAQREMMHAAMATGIEAEQVGQMVLDGVRSSQFWLFTHAELREGQKERAEQIYVAFGEPDPERVAMAEAVMSALGAEGAEGEG